MLLKTMRTRHCTVAAAALVLLAAAAASGGQAPAAPEPVDFTVFLRGVAIGAAQSSVARTPEGFSITGNERTGSPLSIVTRRAEIKYTADWRPLECQIEGSVGDQHVLLSTKVAGTTASTLLTQGAKQTQKTDEIAPNAVLLPNLFFPSYEALAARLEGSKAGDQLPAYVPPQASIAITVKGVTDDRVRTQAALVPVRRYALELAGGERTSNVEVWTDGSGRLIRFAIPAQGFDMVRTDIASITSRREPVSRPNDEQVHVPAYGFSLAGTLSKPASTPAPNTRLPAVVLVSGSSPTDRDEVLAGIPVMGQLASALADAGHVVVRYDKRGAGQSGGRSETATLEDYAEDAIAAVKFLGRRKDVDSKRIALVGYGEGGAVAAVAAAREGDVAALVLVASPGVTGAALVLEQQRRLLAKMDLPDAEKQAKLQLQTAIQQAVLSGQWPDSIPADMRRQADTAWYRSFLLYDPSRTVKKADQPVLIVHGELDRQVEPSNADKLGEIARSRKGRAGQAVTVTRVPGVNHLLVPAKTGEVDEYEGLPDKAVSPQVVSAISSWLGSTMKARR
jgi:pimeloyl-ACP methyl ester carboxylesterase